MNRECDICKGIFKIPKIIFNRLIEDETIKIYCPYCNSLSHHETKENVERGYIK